MCMDKMIFLIAAAVLAGVMAEPPVSRQNLLADQRNAQSQPSNLYGTPAEFYTPRSSIQYAAPTTEYGVPNQSQNSIELSAEFSVPSIASGRMGGANVPYNQYNVRDASIHAQAPSNQYGTPQGSIKFSGSRAPSSQYAAVATSSRFGGEAPSNQYGAPSASSRFENRNSLSSQQSTTAGSSSLSTQFGARGASSRFGGASFLSTQYGAPATSGHFGGAGSLSSQYGAPGGSGRSGAAGSLLAQYDATSRSSAANSLRTQYDAPRVSSRISGPSSLSTRHGANGISSRFGGASSLSSQNGVPGASSRFQSTNSLSTQYGAPSVASRFNAPSSQYAPGGGYAASRGGYNAREDDLAEPANYQYSYEVQDAESGAEFSQEESRQDENAQGSYRVLLPDGRLQIVEYEADQEGYRPQIRYEDIGAGYPSGPQQRGKGQNQGPY